MIKSRENRQLTNEQTKHLGIPGRPSLLQDVIKGRRTEINELNGYITKKGRELGISTPINQAVVKVMKAVENGELNPDPSNMNLLKPFIPK
jgi:2-dehydropantoate 2-reductase